MLFNSIEFLVFFPLVTVLCFTVPSRLRWLMLLTASCWFYMVWMPAYAAVLLISTLISYISALIIARTHDRRMKTAMLCIALMLVVGILFVFKYLGFFNATVVNLLHWLNVSYAPPGLNLLLPLGISFYTFKLLSYVIDVYRGSLAPEKNFGVFALYASFFPQVLAGPIERAGRFLPQLQGLSGFNAGRVFSGLKLMLWGLFKKAVIADHLAVMVDQVYNNVGAYGGAPLWIATYMFAFQIFCDFSGYSDMAIGAARVLGFTTIENFRRPYHAASVAEFWHRWHISLSTWFRDYLYIPLGGNRIPKMQWCAIILLVFVVSGLWHGAAWTFAVWGGLHGLFMIAGRLTHGIREGAYRSLGLLRFPMMRRAIGIFITFNLVAFAWIFFRAANLTDAMYIVTHLFAGFEESLASLPLVFSSGDVWPALAGIAIMEAVHILQLRESPIGFLARKPIWVRWTAYATLILAIINVQAEYKAPFIYMQF
jgi:D-alanyl-lipoteichoic acid acyltransferase DltB (MBOAT superfamily)